ncbi:MAG TPA: hypothetical protein VFM46_01970, partial [Pseudomonadales bacterium]|nr:hypothetical protein [Pseudomonadales bacterium]
MKIISADANEKLGNSMKTLKLSALSLSMALFMAGCTSLQQSETPPAPAAAAKPEIVTLKEVEKPATPHKLDIQKWTTRNGAKVLFYSAPELPMLDV